MREGTTETITLTLEQATDEQLLAARNDAVASARRCEQQGQYVHTWGTRAAAITTELRRRRVEPA